MKVGLAGTGWRAQMYVRVMKALGEEFEVSAVYVHSESSREREEKNFPGKVYTDYDEFLATKPDCVVFMLKYGAALPFAEKAMEQGIPVLCERNYRPGIRQKKNTTEKYRWQNSIASSLIIRH